MVDALLVLGIVAVIGAWFLYAAVDAHKGDGGHAGAAMFVLVTVLALVGLFGLSVAGALWGTFTFLWTMASGVMGVVVVLAVWGVWREVR